MSQNRDKPVDPDPDATITFQRSDLVKPDDDATVMMASRDALKEPAHDDDSTVAMSASGLKAAMEAEAEVPLKKGTPLAAFRTDADPDATVVAPKAQPVAVPVVEAPSRMPMIAGGLVVVAVIAYFVFGGGKAPEPTPTPVARKVESAAPPTAAPVAPAVATAPAAAPVAAAPASVPSKLKDLLAKDIKRGGVTVSEEGGNQVISFGDANQFASGGVDPDAQLRSLLVSVAAALDKTAGSVVVVGHADANPSSNPKFPTNQALSAARAASAAKMMLPKLKDAKRLSSEGVGDTQPLGPSDTAANRAKNRRVVVILKPAS